MIEIKIIGINKPVEVNVIIGQSHFIKTVEDLYEVLITSMPDIKFGLSFCEASGDRLVRFAGNDAELIKLAKDNAMRVGAGHSFFIFLKNSFPINVLNSIKNVQEVCRIFCATSNSVQLLVAATDLGNGILGVVDGQVPIGIEGAKDIKWRKDFLRNILGYKMK